jgi:hypothetical protein
MAGLSPPALRLPLVWPENHPADSPIALRAAAHAAAGLRLDLTLAAAADESRDGPRHATARGLLARGVTELPAIRVGRRWFSGEPGLLEASAAKRRGAIASGPSLAPVG